jgi:tRNA dimethylallyltransferase
VALIAGPTASGKSALALRLAERTGGTVINADASQVYADLRILSARPTAEEEARAPHRLYGHVDAAHACSAAEWAVQARHEITEAQDRGSLPIVVGGSGLYIRTLLEGIAPVPPIAPLIRQEVRALPVEEAHAALAREDPHAAARLRASDTSRVARALEVIRSSGRSLAAWQAEKVGGIGERIKLAPLILLPPRPWLHERIDRRFVTMLDEGAMEEAERLLARELDPSLPAMRAIGVPETAAFLRGDIEKDAVIARGQAATRQYAKRQYTWFAHQPPSAWPRHSEALQGESIGACATLLQGMALT